MGHTYVYYVHLTIHTYISMSCMYVVCTYIYIYRSTTTIVYLSIDDQSLLRTTTNTVDDVNSNK